MLHAKSVIRHLLAFAVFCNLLLIGRMVYSSSIHYIFLSFNLLLAWIPLFISTLLANEEERFKVVLLNLVWLLFFPNAPYIITDFIHLKLRPPVPLWFDALLLYSFATCGLLCGLVSLKILHNKWESRLGEFKAKCVVALVLVLTGYGVYMGRFLRWNSWDIVAHPHHILYDAWLRISNPTHYPRTLAVTVIMGAMLYACFLITGALSKEFSNSKSKNSKQ